MSKKKEEKKEKETAKKKKEKKKLKMEIKEEGKVILEKPVVRKRVRRLPVVEKPMGRSAVHKYRTGKKKIVEEVEVVNEIEVVKEVEKEVITPYICLQYMGGESDINEIVAKAKEMWQENNSSGVEFQSIDLYVKPEDNAAYYVINGTDTGKVGLGL